MSATGHEHTFAWNGKEMPPCECGATYHELEELLHAAAEDARRAAGPPYYAGCGMRYATGTVELWLSNAPPQVVQELEASRPGVYLIHNDAPRPLTVVDDLRDSFDWPARRADGIEVLGVGPSQDGYLMVGVLDDVEGAQEKLDAIYGPNVVRVHLAQRAFPC